MIFANDNFNLAYFTCRCASKIANGDNVRSVYESQKRRCKIFYTSYSLSVRNEENTSKLLLLTTARNNLFYYLANAAKEYENAFKLRWVGKNELAIYLV